MEEKQRASSEAESAPRRAWDAVCAFFGISTKTRRASRKRAKLVGDVLTYAVLIVGAFFMVYPFWWMLAGSFAYTAERGTQGDILNNMIWWPSVSTFMPPAGVVGVGAFFNYAEVFTNAFGKLSSGFTFWRALFNNLLYSVVPVSVGVITSASAAFSFAKLDWKGRNVVFYFLLAAIMIPGPSIMVSQFVMYDNLGWRTNGLVLIVPGMFGSIMTAFFIRQFLFGLPTSIIEAAQIDGAGYPRVFVGFILPLALPAIMAQAVLSFMGCWNNYLGSFIMIPPQSEWINLPHAIVLMEKSYEGNYAVMIAASVICVLPVMVLFACFQKLIIGSLMLTGSKE